MDISVGKVAAGVRDGRGGEVTMREISARIHSVIKWHRTMHKHCTNVNLWFSSAL